MAANVNEVPATLGVETAGLIVDPNMGRVTAYQRATLGDLPTIRFGKRVYVVTHRLAELIGRPITSADVDRANVTIRERNEAQALRRAAAITSERKG